MPLFAKGWRWFIEVKIAITSHPPLSVSLFIFLLGQCKEHDLAMINQLLDDPKLTARKYREWKLMNTLLIQDIYQQHQQRRTPTSASEGSPQKPPSSARLENSIWEQARMLSSPVLPLRQLFKTLRELNIFPCKGKLKPSSWKHQLLLEGCGWDENKWWCCLTNSSARIGLVGWSSAEKTVSVFLLGLPTTLGSRWDMQTIFSVSCSQEKDSIPRAGSLLTRDTSS